MSKSYRKLYIKTLPSYSRFSLLRKVMDAEMKESTKKDLALRTQNHNENQLQQKKRRY